MCGLAGIHYDDPQAVPDRDLLQRMVGANRLGRKSGRGFYDYSKK